MILATSGYYPGQSRMGLLVSEPRSVELATAIDLDNEEYRVESLPAPVVPQIAAPSRTQALAARLGAFPEPEAPSLESLPALAREPGEDG